MEMKKQPDRALTIQEFFYCLFFSLLFFAKGIGLYDGQSLFKVFLIAALACFCMKMLMTDYTVKELVILLTLLAVVLLSYFRTKEKGILFTFAIAAGLKNVSVKRIFQTALAVWCVSYIPTVLLTTLGWADSPFRVHTLGNGKCPPECRTYRLPHLYSIGGVYIRKQNFMEMDYRVVYRQFICIFFHDESDRPAYDFFLSGCVSLSDGSEKSFESGIWVSEMCGAGVCFGIADSACGADGQGI